VTRAVLAILPVRAIAATTELVPSWFDASAKDGVVGEAKIEIGDDVVDLINDVNRKFGMRLERANLAPMAV
jgi:hypothetical protein